MRAYFLRHLGEKHKSLDFLGHQINLNNKTNTSPINLRRHNASINVPYLG